MGYIPNPSAEQKKLANRPFNSSFKLHFRNGQKFTITGVQLRQEENRNDESKPFIFSVITTSLGEKYDITRGILCDENRTIADVRQNQENEQIKPFILYPLGDLQASVKGTLSEYVAKLSEKFIGVDELFEEVYKELKSKEFEIRNYRPILSISDFDIDRKVTSKMICDIFIL